MQIDLEQYDLISIDSISIGNIEHVFDIEVDSEDHAFIAKSPSGAIGISHNSAMISLSNLSDDRMRHAKAGAWWEQNVQRALSNNSAVYTERPEVGAFMQEWLSLYESKSGERGIFNREACTAIVSKYGRRDCNHEFGCNPCCLPGDVVLTTKEHGLMTMKEIVDNLNKTDISVLSYNHENDICEYVPVEAAKATRPNAELIELEIDTEVGTKTLRLTPDHRVYTKNRGYVRADELNENDDLVIAV